MKVLTVNGSEIELYNSIDEIPMTRYNTMQKQLLQDVYVGSDFAAISKHFNNLDFYLQNKKIAEAQQERLNMHNGMFMQLNEYNTSMRIMCAMIKSVDDTEFKDLTDEGLDRACKALGDTDITKGELEKYLTEVKKKLTLS